jgi:hypothetical protein
MLSFSWRSKAAFRALICSGPMAARNGHAEHFGDEPRLHSRRQGRKVCLAVLDPPRFKNFVIPVAIGAADSGRLRGVTRRWIGRRRTPGTWNRWATGVLRLCRTHFLASNGAVDDLLALVFVRCGQRGDLALLVERRADDLLQHVVADLRGFADFAGNGGAVAAGLFRMSVDEGEGRADSDG